MQSFINEMNIVDRVVAPCPLFFKKIRNIALIIGGVATAVLTAPVSLPAIAVTVAGYLVTASGVAVTISQCTVDGDKLP
jgi:hypothetical protein